MKDTRMSTASTSSNHPQTITNFILRELTKGPRTLDALRQVPELKWVPLKDLRSILSFLVERGHATVTASHNVLTFKGVQR
jgi:hypothetical protein